MARPKQQSSRATEILVTVTLWIRVALSPVLIGAALAALALILVGGRLGPILAAGFVALGVACGVLLAERARHRGELPDLAGGLPPPHPEDETAPQPGSDAKPRDR